MRPVEFGRRRGVDGIVFLLVIDRRSRVRFPDVRLLHLTRLGWTQDLQTGVDAG